MTTNQNEELFHQAVEEAFDNFSECVPGWYEGAWTTALLKDNLEAFTLNLLEKLKAVEAK